MVCSPQHWAQSLTSTEVSKQKGRHKYTPGKTRLRCGKQGNIDNSFCIILKQNQIKLLENLESTEVKEKGMLQRTVNTYTERDM